MNETQVTVVGFVGTKPDERVVGNTTVTSFRLGSTPRVFSSRENQWVDRETNWYTVNAWRALGQNCFHSLHIGDPVIVQGRLQTQVWGDEDQRRTTLVLDATSVGHDLARGTSAFLKSVRETPVPSPDEEGLIRSNASLETETGQITSDGRFLASSGRSEPAEGETAREPVTAPF